MTKTSTPCGRSRLSGGFTFTGKPAPDPHLVPARAAKAAAAILLFALAAPAAGRPEMGSTSSESISISVSVAPRYGLTAEGSGRQERSSTGGGNFCIATNGRPTSLPVLLVRSGAGQSSEADEPLPWCQAGSGLTARSAERGGNVGLLLIRPE